MPKQYFTKTKYRLGSNQHVKHGRGLSIQNRITLIVIMLLVTGTAFLVHEIEAVGYENSQMRNPYIKVIPVSQSERRGTTSAVINRFFEKHNSPLFGLGEVFYDEAVSNGLPIYLLPSVACAESSCGKNYIKSTENFFGWGRGKIVFKNKVEAIRVIASKLATMEHYKDFRESKEIGQFCISYNAPEAATYCKTIRSFIREFEKTEFDL